MAKSFSSQTDVKSSSFIKHNTPKSNLWGISAFLVFVVLIALLYVQNRGQWKDENVNQQVRIDSLQNLSQELSHRIEFMQQAEKQRTESIRKELFDSFDEKHYRVYGLFRDHTKKMTREAVAQKFNIYNASAISSSDALGERWFTVPVKGVHFMREDETIEEIAAKYYGNQADSSLIIAFNPIVKPFRNLFIPFSN